MVRHQRDWPDPLEAGAARGSAAAIEAKHPLVLRRPHQHHGVAAQAAHHRFGQRQHAGHRHGGISGIAPLLQHPQAHPGHQGRAGGGHGPACKHRRAAIQKGRVGHDSVQRWQSVRILLRPGLQPQGLNLVARVVVVRVAQVDLTQRCRPFWTPSAVPHVVQLQTGGMRWAHPGCCPAGFIPGRDPWWGASVGS